MLYDPKWEVPVKADPFALSTLIAWLEKRPASGQYCYASHGKCLLASYFLAHGFQKVSMGGFSMTLDGKFGYLPEAFAQIASDEPHTFGAALERAREYID